MLEGRGRRKRPLPSLHHPRPYKIRGLFALRNCVCQEHTSILIALFSEKCYSRNRPIHMRILKGS
jgi:hypothetical protein